MRSSSGPWVVRARVSRDCISQLFASPMPCVPVYGPSCCRRPPPPPHRYLHSSKQAAPGSDSGQVVVYEWGEAADEEMGSSGGGGGLHTLVSRWLADYHGAGPAAAGNDQDSE